MLDDIVVVSAARTPIGSMQGALSTFAAHDLGAHVIREALTRATLRGDQIDELIMGCVLTAGQAQAPARQAAATAGLPRSVSASSVNKVCGSGMKAVMMANDILIARNAEILVVGGMESMSNAPYLMLKGRGGYRFGHGTLFDHMTLDGLEDAYDKTPNGGGKPMGQFAEDCAEKYGFTREDQDHFAIASMERARAANLEGSFKWEVAPIEVGSKSGNIVIGRDEAPFKVDTAKVANLKPAFRKDGTVTAASSSPISDGAAALIVMRESNAVRLGCTPIARLIAQTNYSGDPQWFTTAPVAAIQKLYQKTGWSSADVDLFEVNEAFAVVPLAVMEELQIPHDKMNIHGGACALGHPIGASGARIIVTLIGALRRTGGKRGIAAVCIGGGEATAVALELA